MAMAAILGYSGGSVCVDDERTDVAHYSTPLDSKSVVFQRRRSADIPTGSGLPYMETVRFHMRVLLLACVYLI